jgi:hypothetical protein
MFANCESLPQFSGECSPTAKACHSFMAEKKEE